MVFETDKISTISPIEALGDDISTREEAGESPNEANNKNFSVLSVVCVAKILTILRTFPGGNHER